MLRMNAQLQKHNRKTILMEVGEESKRNKLEEQLNFIKELQRRVRHLELEKISGFADLRYSALPAISVGYFG